MLQTIRLRAVLAKHPVCCSLPPQRMQCSLTRKVTASVGRLAEGSGRSIGLLAIALKELAGAHERESRISPQPPQRFNRLRHSPSTHDIFSIVTCSEVASRNMDTVCFEVTSESCRSSRSSDSVAPACPATPSLRTQCQSSAVCIRLNTFLKEYGSRPRKMPWE